MEIILIFLIKFDYIQNWIDNITTFISNKSLVTFLVRNEPHDTSQKNVDETRQEHKWWGKPVQIFLSCGESRLQIAVEDAGNSVSKDQ